MAPSKLSLRKCRVGVVGLGYVGLPLAVEFGKHFETVGFDIKAGAHRAAASAAATARSRSTRAELQGARKRLSFTTRACRSSSAASVFIVTVPTPIDDYKRPDLTPLVRASETVGKVLQQGRRRRLRVDRLSGLHRGSLRADPRARVGPEVQPRLLRRLQPRAHQSRRQGAPADRRSARSPPGSTPRGRRLRRRALRLASSPPARTRPRASAWPRPPRSSRTRSATSTSR